MIYEVQITDTGFMVRPAGEGLGFIVENLNPIEFLDRFEECWTIQ